MFGRLAATEANPIDTRLNLTDLGKFMTKLDFTPDPWSRRPAMLPQTNLLLSLGLVDLFIARLGTITIGGEPVEYRQRDHGFISIVMRQRILAKFALAPRPAHWPFGDCRTKKSRISPEHPPNSC